MVSAASTEGRTSCTRTPQTPAAAQCAVMAVVASSRSVTGRGVPDGVGEQRAEERLARRGDQHRQPQLDQRVELGQQGPVVPGVLGEPQARVDHELRLRDPGGEGGVDPVQQLGAHLSTTSS